MSVPLALLHGFCGAPESWRRVVELLGPPAGGTPVARPALLGHDPAALHDDAVDFSGEVARLGALLRAQAAGGWHLVGYSLGARVALGLLVEHPALFARATLIGVHPGLRSDAERSSRIGQDDRWARLLEAHGLEEFVRAWEAQPLFATQAALPREIDEEQRRIRLGHDAHGLARSLRVLGLGCMPDYAARLAAVACSVRVVAGALDTKFSALAAPLAAALGNGRAEIVPEAGHNLLLERPRRVAELIREGSRA